MEGIEERNERLLFLARKARESGDCRSDELGRMVDDICQKALRHKFENGMDFAMYSDDVKADMLGHSSLRVLEAVMSKAKLEDGRKLFNYLYATALNSCRNVLTKHYLRVNFELMNWESREVSVETLSESSKKFVMSDYVKTRFLYRSRAAASLRRVVNMNIGEFVKTLNKRKLARLVRLARKIREAA